MTTNERAHIEMLGFSACGAGWHDDEAPGAHAAIVAFGPDPAEGASVIRRLRRAGPQRPILALAAKNRPALALAAVQAGADGCLHDDASPAQICLAVEQIRAGLSPLSPCFLLSTLASASAHDTDDDTRPVFSLTAREREVLALLVRGHAYQSVACALGIGIGTVQTHVRNLYRKLEISSKAEAASLAIRYGLVA